MAIVKVLVTISVLMFGQVLALTNSGSFDNVGLDNTGFDRGFDNADFDRGYFENGFDDNGMFLDSTDDSFPVQRGILGGPIVTGGIAGSAGRVGGMGRPDYIPQRPQPRFDDRVRGDFLGSRVSPMRQRPLVIPRPRIPMVLPPIGGGVRGFPRYPKMGGAMGGILGGGRMSYPRRRIASPIGGNPKPRGYGRTGSGGIAGMSRRRFRTY